PAAAGIPPLSLHDALPILLLTPEGGRGARVGSWGPPFRIQKSLRKRAQLPSIVSRPNRHEPFPSSTLQAVAWADRRTRRRPCFRSEEHTSELQSRENLVCR